MHRLPCRKPTVCPIIWLRMPVTTSPCRICIRCFRVLLPTVVISMEAVRSIITMRLQWTISAATDSGSPWLLFPIRYFPVVPLRYCFRCGCWSCWSLWSPESVLLLLCTVSGHGAGSYIVWLMWILWQMVIILPASRRNYPTEAETAASMLPWIFRISSWSIIPVVWPRVTKHCWKYGSSCKPVHIWVNFLPTSMQTGSSCSCGIMTGVP